MRESEQKSVAEHLFSQHEESFEHASYDRELAFYESICSGNMELVRVFMKPLFCDGCGVLSEDSLRNLKYHLVILAAIIARYCIKGGMTPEESYGLSDFYILKTDKCSTEKELRAVHLEMIEGYTNKMRQIKLNGVYSKQIVHAVNYIICRLHSRVTLEQTAAHLKISSAYLSRLFKKETGMTFSDYVNKLKIEEAATLLINTEYPDTEISSMLGFSSQSYFIKVFRRYMNTTPKQYKRRYDHSFAKA
ncbi:MAG TPA: AraC family transcriptional regulator [Ruminococcus sp.]|jgi:AraC family transcriptional regulator|nr:AraC family transcriptional regulator [Ruminococcus sp.]